MKGQEQVATIKNPADPKTKIPGKPKTYAPRDYNIKAEAPHDYKLKADAPHDYKLKAPGRNMAQFREQVTLDPDGFDWRKYGEKVLAKPTRCRAYFKCAHAKHGNCPALKAVDMCLPTKESLGSVSVMYQRQHNHRLDPLNSRKAPPQHKVSLPLGLRAPGTPAQFFWLGDSLTESGGSGGVSLQRTEWDLSHGKPVSCAHSMPLGETRPAETVPGPAAPANAVPAGGAGGSGRPQVHQAPSATPCPSVKVEPTSQRHDVAVHSVPCPSVSSQVDDRSATEAQPLLSRAKRARLEGSAGVSTTHGNAADVSTGGGCGCGELVTGSLLWGRTEGAAVRAMSAMASGWPMLEGMSEEMVMAGTLVHSEMMDARAPLTSVVTSSMMSAAYQPRERVLSCRGTTVKEEACMELQKEDESQLRTAAHHDATTAFKAADGSSSSSISTNQPSLLAYTTPVRTQGHWVCGCDVMQPGANVSMKPSLSFSDALPGTQPMPGDVARPYTRSSSTPCLHLRTSHTLASIPAGAEERAGRGVGAPSLESSAIPNAAAAAAVHSYRPLGLKGTADSWHTGAGGTDGVADASWQTRSPTGSDSGADGPSAGSPSMETKACTFVLVASHPRSSSDDWLSACGLKDVFSDDANEGPSGLRRMSCAQEGEGGVALSRGGKVRGSERWTMEQVCSMLGLA